MAVVWPFACQRDSYLKQFDTRVVSCEYGTLEVGQRTVKGRNVVFEDTILFPEGGGQNDDHGTINHTIPVIRVTREGKNAIHFLDTDLDLRPGEMVKQTVDWRRRFDNMQQHSGQHLISAIFERDFRIRTTSWWMAENHFKDGRTAASFVGLEVEGLAESVVEKVEESCNEAIRRHLEVSVKLYSGSSSELQRSKTRGLPVDVQDRIRVIEIGDENGLVDSNMCCGTHVSNLAHLQAIKLLHWERAKKDKGKKTFLYFVVGDRVLSYFGSCFHRERLLISMLSSCPEDHVKVVEKTIGKAKAATKRLKGLQEELAVRDAFKIRDEKLDKFCVYRIEADADYANRLIREVDDPEVLLVICTGDPKLGTCQLSIFGPEDKVKVVTPKVLKLLEAKGGGKGNRVNAKVQSVDAWSRVKQELL